MTEVELLLGVEAVRDESINDAMPDAVYMHDGDLYAIEVDNAGKQSRRQYAEKWRRYGQFEGFILVVCHSEKRLESIVRWAEPQKQRCLFSTFARLSKKLEFADCYGATILFDPDH